MILDRGLLFWATLYVMNRGDALSCLLTARVNVIEMLYAEKTREKNVMYFACSFWLTSILRQIVFKIARRYCTLSMTRSCLRYTDGPKK